MITQVISVTWIVTVIRTRRASGQPDMAGPSARFRTSTGTNTTAISTCAMRCGEGCGTLVPGGGSNQNSRPVIRSQAASAANRGAAFASICRRKSDRSKASSDVRLAKRKTDRYSPPGAAGRWNSAPR